MGSDVTIIEVFDKDVGRDDFLGKLELLDEDIIKYKTVVNKWIPLQKCKTGEIQLSAQYIDLSENPGALKDLNRLEDEQEALEEKERLEKEREALYKFVPEDILQGLPAEFAELLQSEVGKAREKLLTEEETPKEEKKEEETSQEKPEVPEANNDLNEILGMVDGLDEGSSKYIYEQLQIIFNEIAEEEKETRLATLKEELLNLQVKQNELMPKVPTEITSSLPEDMAKQLEEAMRDAYQKLAEKETGESKTSQITTVNTSKVNGSQKEIEVKEMVTEFLSQDPTNLAENKEPNKHEEVRDMINEFFESSDEETEKGDDPIPGIPEELLRNLPPEMAESLKKNYDQSMRDIARKEVEKTEQTVSNMTKLKIETDVNKYEEKKEKDSKSQLEDETEVISPKADDVEDEEDMSLPPTPAVATPWSEIAARP